MSDLNFSLSSGVKPMIRETASMHNDGGGGNLGYMQRRQKKDKDDRRRRFNESIFGHKNDEIMFSSKEINMADEGFSSDFIVGIVEKIIKFLETTFLSENIPR